MQQILQIISHSEEETAALAEKLAPTLRPGDVLVLQGELGAGKTEFVRGLAAALEIDPTTVNSPSYTIVNEYPGPRPLYHFDLYRLGDPSELYEIGWDDYLGRDGLIAVEWGERAGSMLPSRYYLLQFRILSEAEREISLSVVTS